MILLHKVSSIHVSKRTKYAKSKGFDLCTVCNRIKNRGELDTFFNPNKYHLNSLSSISMKFHPYVLVEYDI